MLPISRPSAIMGWLRRHDNTDQMAGCAFLIGPNIVVTCSHVVRDHLGLSEPLSVDPPTEPVIVRFEALQRDVVGHVISGGWFSNARPPPGVLFDIAVISLRESLAAAISPLPAIAGRMPTYRKDVLIYGAESDYAIYGQEVKGEMAGDNITGADLRQINPTSARGYTVERGFSGSPVMDEIGTVVWGMIAKVDTRGSGVAYAIPADKLRAALDSSGVEATVRLSNATDVRAEEALALLNAEIKPQLAASGPESERMQQELDQLKDGIRGLVQRARSTENADAVKAIDALASDNAALAIEFLRREWEEQLIAVSTARLKADAAQAQISILLRRSSRTTLPGSGLFALGPATVRLSVAILGAGLEELAVIDSSTIGAHLIIELIQASTIPVDVELSIVIGIGLLTFTGLGNTWTGVVTAPPEINRRHRTPVRVDVPISRNESEMQGVEMITCNAVRYRNSLSPSWGAWHYPVSSHSIVVQVV